MNSPLLYHGGVPDEFLHSLWAKPDGPRYPAKPEPVSRLGPDGRVSLSRRKLSIEWSGK